MKNLGTIDTNELGLYEVLKSLQGKQVKFSMSVNGVFFESNLKAEEVIFENNEIFVYDYSKKDRTFKIKTDVIENVLLNCPETNAIAVITCSNQMYIHIFKI